MTYLLLFTIESLVIFLYNAENNTLVMSHNYVTTEHVRNDIVHKIIHVLHNIWHVYKDHLLRDGIKNRGYKPLLESVLASNHIILYFRQYNHIMNENIAVKVFRRLRST